MKFKKIFLYIQWSQLDYATSNKFARCTDLDLLSILYPCLFLEMEVTHAVM